VRWLLVDEDADKRLCEATKQMGDIIGRCAILLNKMSNVSVGLGSDDEVGRSVDSLLAEFNSWDKGTRAAYLCSFYALASIVDKLMKDSDPGVTEDTTTDK